MRKINFVALAGGSAAAVLILSAGPAAAHAVFVGAPQGVPTDTDQALVMNVPHERDDTTINVDVQIAMPSGWQPQACETKPTWSCAIETSSGRQVVHFAKAAGAAPAEDETFRFTVHAPATVGASSFPTVQTYNTGEVVRWIDAAGGAQPAPQLRTVASGVAPTTVAPPATIAVAPTTPVATTAAPTPATTAPTPTPTTTSLGSSSAITSTSTTAPGAASPSTTITRSSGSTTSTTPGSGAATDDGAGGGGGGGGGGGSAAIAIVAAIVVVAGAAGALVLVRRRGVA